MGLFDSLSGSGGDAGKPREFTLGGNPFFQAHLNRKKGPDDVRLGATGALGDLQAQLFGQAGIFGSSGGPGAGFAGNQGLAFLQQLAAQGGAQPTSLSGTPTVNPFGQAQGLIDPLGVAQNQFDQGMSFLQPEFDRQNLGLESRLHSQGRLGGSGTLSGQSEVEALRRAQGDQQNKLLFDSLNQGLFAQNQGFGQELAGQEQAFGQALNSANQRFGQDATIADLGFNQNLQAGNQLFNFGSGLSQLDPQLRGLFQGLDLNALQGGLGIQNTANNTFNSLAGAQGIEPQQSGGLFGGLDAGGLLGAGLINSGVSQFDNFLGGLFGPQDPFAAGNNKGFVGR